MHEFLKKFRHIEEMVSQLENMSEKNNQPEIWEKKERKLLGEKWREEVNILY